MRFATAHDVLLAFPQITAGLRTPLDDTPARDFLDRLVATGRASDAIAFLAHVLPRREAVWWAAKCVRMEPKAFDSHDERLLADAERWVREPDDAWRRDLLARADAADATRAATWVARAAGWSGGLLRDVGGSRIACQPHMSPAASRAAVLFASAHADDRKAYLSNCIAEGMKLLN